MLSKFAEPLYKKAELDIEIEGARILIWHTKARTNKVDALLESRFSSKPPHTWLGRLGRLIFFSRLRRFVVWGAILFPGLFRLGQLGNFNVWRLLQYPIVIRYLKQTGLASEPGHRSVLDLGSSDTPFPSFLAQRYGQNVISLDKDPTGVAWQMETYRTWSLNGKTVLADLEHIPFRDGSFSAISCISVLEHVEQDAKAINDIERLLGENGWFILSVPFSFAAGKEVKQADGSLFFRYYSLPELAHKFSKFVLREQYFAGKQLTEAIFHPDRPIQWGRAIPLDYFLGNILNILERLVWGGSEPKGIGSKACRVEGIYLFRRS